MKKILLIILSGILIGSFQVVGQTCTGDSVAINYYIGEVVGFPTFNEVIDTFYLATGEVKSCRYTSSSASWQGYSCNSLTPFTRKYIERTSLKDTSVYVEMKGNGSGYDRLKRLEFNYDSDGNTISRMEYSGGSSSWLSHNSDSWSYLPGHILSVYTRQSDLTTPGILENEIRKTYSYNGNVIQSIQIEKGNGVAWQNNVLYNFFRGVTGSTDSLFVQKWDDQQLTYVDSIHVPFDPFNNNTALLTDTIGGNRSFYLDTLGRAYEFVDSYSNGDFLDEKYAYIKGRQLVSVYTFVSYFGCSDHNSYNLDTNGVIIFEDGSSACWSQTYLTAGYYYDENYRLMHSTRSSYSGASSGSGDTYYIYPTSDTLIINAQPISFYNGGVNPCEHSAVYYNPQIYGGCGPYTVSWSPTYGLSDPTSINPLISVDSSVVYTITVSDTTGHTATAQLNVEPGVTLELFADTISCQGCPQVLHANSSATNNAFYQWYLNGAFIDGATDSVLIAYQSGWYSVSCQTYNSISCSIMSDSVYINTNGTTRLMGYLYFDEDSDCIRSIADSALYTYNGNLLNVIVSQGSYAVPALPDSNGFYNFPIDTGTFQLTFQNPSSNSIFNCPSAGIVSVNIASYGDTVYQDFSLKSTLNSITEFEGNNFSIYPNPAYDQFTISGLPENTSVSLIDLNGRTLHQYFSEGKDLIIPTTDLASSIYILRFSDSGRNVFRRVVVRK